METYKVLYYNGMPKFICGNGLMGALKVIRPLNLISLLKVIFSYMFSKRYTVNQVVDLCEKHLEGKFKLKEFHALVLGSEIDYKKITILNSRVVTKIMNFRSNKLAVDYQEKFDFKYQYVKNNLESSFENVITEKVINTKLDGDYFYIESEFRNDISFSWLKAIKLIPKFILSLKSLNGTIYTLHDFKLHNISFVGDKIFLYDMESLGEGNWTQSSNHFIKNLKYYSKYSFWSLLLYIKLRD
ncbi:hypothetical protein AAFX24_19930 [Vibrio mediterranei]|uniref:hypothetical protein n=1 Tax=Vibrio mediterranei TaxID=689 RepID=UPI0038CDDCE1